MLLYIRNAQVICTFIDRRGKIWRFIMHNARKEHAVRMGETAAGIGAGSKGHANVRRREHAWNFLIH